MKYAHRIAIAAVALVVVASPLSGIRAQEAEREPVVIVPGILGSWNLDNLMTYTPDGEWTFPPVYKTYDNLIKALEDEGYVRDETLFVAFYDWRQSNILSASDYLKHMIDKALAHSPTGRVDVVAHSMGGLVARAYIQSDSYEDDIDQLVLLGTPNYGSSDVYTLWEGGRVPENWSISERWLLNIYLTHLNLITHQTNDNYDTVRTYIPSVGELMPVYNYLTDKETGDELSDVYENRFLYNLWDDVYKLNSVNRLTIVTGTGEPTVGWIPVVPRESEETKLWVYGKPDPLDPERNDTEGDNRVLAFSSEISKWEFVAPVLVQKPNFIKSIFARLFPIAYADRTLDAYNVDEFLVNKTIQAKHSDLPTKAIPHVLSALGLNAPSTEFVPPVEPDNITTFWFASPVEVQVTDPQGRSVSKNTNSIPGAVYDGVSDPDGVKIIVIPDSAEGDYKAELTGTADGSYHMAVSTFTDVGEQTAVVSKDIKEGEKVTYVIAIDPEDTTILPNVGEPVIELPNEPEEPASEMGALEMIDNLIDDVASYSSSGKIKKESVSKQLLSDLKTAKKLLEEASKVGKPGKKLPKLHEFKARALETATVIKMGAFKFKIVVNERKDQIDSEAANDLRSKAEIVISKIRE